MTASKVTRISSILTSALVLALSLMIAAPLAGCSGSPKPAAEGTAGDYMSLFKSGQYARAYEVASAQAQRTRGYEADRASLYAGMSAHALDRNADARRWLTPVVGSGDREISPLQPWSAMMYITVVRFFSPPLCCCRLILLFAFPFSKEASIAMP